jgi:hypothetical protein
MWLFIASTIIFSILFPKFALLHVDTRAPSFSRLTLELATTKEGFVLREPIPLILTLGNKTQESIIGHKALGLSYNLIELFTLHNGEKRKIENLSPLQKLVRVNPISIGPGERHQAKELLTLDLDKLFPRPGTYQIQAVLHDVSRKEQIQSNILTIYIHEPAGLDLLAYEYLKKNANPSNFFTGLELSGNEQGQKVLEGFVSNFSGTSYWDYAADMLAGFYFVKKEYEKAIELYAKVAAKTNFLFADNVLYRLLQAHVRLDNLGMARQYLSVLNAQYPGSDYTEKAEVFISQESRKKP